VNIVDETIEGRKETIWIVILVIGVIMIITLITVYAKQSKTPRSQV
jgi:flagellar basal body-associated protein FliL